MTLPDVANSPGQPSPLRNLLPHLLRMLRREPAVAITIGYLLVAMAGIFYNVSFYRQFDIPVLTLSQVSDFLVAGVQQPMALVLVLSTLPVCWIMDFFNTRARRKDAARLERVRASGDRSFLARLRMRYWSWRVEQLWSMQVMYFIVVILYGWIFVSLYARDRADAVHQGRATQVRVWLNGDSNGLVSQSPTWTYLGAVANYVFLYDPASRKSVVLPVNNVARIEPVAMPGKAASAVIVAPIP